MWYSGSVLSGVIASGCIGVSHITKDGNWQVSSSYEQAQDITFKDENGKWWKCGASTHWQNMPLYQE